MKKLEQVNKQLIMLFIKLRFIFFKNKINIINNYFFKISIKIKL